MEKNSHFLWSLSLYILQMSLWFYQNYLMIKCKLWNYFLIYTTILHKSGLWHYIYKSFTGGSEERYYFDMTKIILVAKDDRMIMKRERNILCNRAILEQVSWENKETYLSDGTYEEPPSEHTWEKFHDCQESFPLIIDNKTFFKNESDI